ncbi:MAG: nicotinate-nucleotide diphosphorylase (carboxylating) [Omnitrophica WOR_2 bacterium RIFCSPHIGHO2_02_FULL_50_17]|nr:MAG: nicotinate-nucleotide diphosphorylase (carboxylating) [Omnitrophica WOR_2 bacterium RIFCSPHIGHO2_02_FULL_50_17]
MLDVTAEINRIIEMALREDTARNDVTTNSLIDPRQIARAEIVVRQEAVVCGLDIVQRVFQKLDKSVKLRFFCKEGEKVRKDTRILLLKGKTRALLSGERTALNFLGHLSGVASAARQYVEAIYPCRTKILDTRKTTPGLRVLEKYAVRCGGAFNHRRNLQEMVIIKDNHRTACRQDQSIVGMVSHLRRITRKVVEVEVDTLPQFQEALEAGADVILLDNMTAVQIQKAVQMRGRMKKRPSPLLEASGGITLQNVRRMAQTGVERISIGALTHSHRFVDVSMELAG